MARGGGGAPASPAVPTTTTPIDVRAKDLDAQLVSLCKQLVGGWSAIDVDEAAVHQIDGGITNMLYKVAPRAGGDRAAGAPAVLVRVFGEAGNAVCDRARENALVAELSAQDFGPKLLAVFGNGRLEAFLDGRRPLTPLEMLQVEPVDFVGMTARRLADMHARCRCSGGADLWAQLREWVALAKKVSFPDGSEKAEKLKRLDPFPRFENELNALEDRLPSSKNSNGAALLEARSGVDRRALELLLEIRFCHLDLLSGNIMYSEEAGDVVFIDFEYANSCCIGFDIANHYNAVPESCLILENKFDAEMYFPSGVQQRHWFQAYLEARGIPADEELLGGLLRVVLEFSLFAELRWVIWSVVQAGHSPVDFDYLDYGVMRFEEGYMKYKAWCEAGGRP